MDDAPLKPALGERRDQSVYILSFKPKLIKVGRGLKPTLRRWYVARSWDMPCSVAWAGSPHPRAMHIERMSHRMLEQFRIDQREMFACTIATARAVIRAATIVQDEWLRANPEWLEDHTAKRQKAVAAYNDWHRATKLQRRDSGHARYP